MAEIRLHQSWSPSELRARLSRARVFPDDVGVPEDEMTPGRGWNQVQSDAVICRERPGPPERGGPYGRARSLVEPFAFSDPRIVIGHYDPAQPLLGREVWLELQALGFHFLSPVRIGAVRSDSNERRTLFGYRFDTLPGHIESGREWFLLRKDHATGEVHFRIRACWRAGDLRHWWMKLGFALLGRRYQRAWHHLAHLRLRRMIAENLGAAAPDAEGLEHQGPPLPGWKLLAYGGRKVGVRLTRVEQESERMRRDRWMTVAGLGVMAGMRSFSAPALVAHYYARKHPRRRGPLVRFLQKKGARRALTTMAAGELIADKLPRIPPRVAPPLLAGRALSGAFAGAAMADAASRSRWRMGLLGAAAAIASSFAFYTLRQHAVTKWRVPGLAAAVAEDAAVGALGAGLLSGLERARAF